jgi:hypothetical protein
MKNGTIELKVLNLDDSVNSPYIPRYNLETQALILSRIENGKEKKWIQLDKVWDFTAKFPEFRTYTINAIKDFLKE